MAFSHSGSHFVSASGDRWIDGLLSGNRWREPVIRYSDPDNSIDYGIFYDSDFDGDGLSAPFEPAFAQLDARQLVVLHAALDAGALSGGGVRAGFAVSGFTELKLRYAGSGSYEAEIRVASSSDYSGAYAYYPGANDLGGDVWLSGMGAAPVAGNDDCVTVLHELGHALGLKHGHEAEHGFGRLPRSYDCNEFSVMTYRTFVGASDSDIGTYERWGAPQSYMMLDIAALQYMYGANFESRSGATMYRWKPGCGDTWIDGKVAIDAGGDVIFATIWDGGGKDTYDLSAFEDELRIDLRPGRWSVFSEDQLSDLGGGPNGGRARANIYNALQFENDPRSLIENVRGGSGDDHLRGNAVQNRLQGKDGDDILVGAGAGDLLVGGKGADIFRCRATGESKPGGCDTILAGNGGEALAGPGRTGGDLIDVSRIDARWDVPGNQAFRFGEAHGKGWLWVEGRRADTVVFGNTAGDSEAEFKLVIEDGSVEAFTYSEADFLL